MDADPAALPDDIEALKIALLAERARADAAQTEAAVARAEQSDARALIVHLKLQIEKLRREIYGQRSERSTRLLDQMELQLEELEATATEDELEAEKAAAKTTNVAAFSRKRSSRKPFPEHLPRERVVVPGPTACACCGGARLSKLGEDITETLEVIPRQWKVIQHVREKFTCRDCKRISQPPAPFHVIARGWAGPSLLAMLAPIFERIEAHVFAAARLHGDDTTVPVLARGKTDIARSWVYVRDDRPFGGPAPPAAVFYYSRDRGGAHPQAHLAGYTGILQADAYGGYGKLYEATRLPGPITQAACWSHARRKFFVLADLAANAQRKAQGKTPAFVSPVALAAVRRIDALFDIERGINGQSAADRLAVRQRLSAPLVEELEGWMRQERAKFSRHNDVAQAMDYMLNRWPAFTRFLHDGRICLTNNAAERALRGIALGRKAWLFAGSDRGGQRAAMMYSLIVSAKMNDIDPQAWLADVLARIADHPAQKLDELLPWSWQARERLEAA